jgi:hypothetical protein
MVDGITESGMNFASDNVFQIEKSPIEDDAAIVRRAVGLFDASLNFVWKN